MISPRFKRLLSDNVTTSDGRVMPTTALLHLDQGISLTSHASQGKTVDNVIVSAPVAGLPKSARRNSMFQCPAHGALCIC